MVGWPSCHLRLNTGEAKPDQIKLIDEDIDRPNRIGGRTRMASGYTSSEINKNVDAAIGTSKVFKIFVDAK